MVPTRDLLSLLVTAIVVAAAVGAGVDGPNQSPGPLPEPTETVPDSADLQRYAAVTERALRWAHELVRSLTAPVRPFHEHPAELLLVFELGLLVEHLQMLDRVDDTLVDRLVRSPIDPGADGSERWP